MKRTFSLILAFCLVFTIASTSAYAASSSQTSAQQIIQVLGIITGDQDGTLNLTNNVTRAQFAKMMIAASTYKDSISTKANSSPFKDVKYTHWAASYVQAAVKSGWLTGYSDGTFRPDNNVKLEEAVSALLKMLGYTSSDFSGAFPKVQLAKYISLGLNEGISATQGQFITRQDCVNLFYNLLNTKEKSGNYYATSLGYTVNSTGGLDFSSLVLAKMSGPFVIMDSNWSSSLPFSLSTVTIFKNGSPSSLSAASKFDVYYYNIAMRTVWIYNNKVTGIYTAATPSTSLPSSVTVAGKIYSISTSSASYKLSSIGNYKLGDAVTLILGMNGDVIEVLSPSTTNAPIYGFVLSTGTNKYSDIYGNSYGSDTISIASTDGNTYEYEYSGYKINTGTLVEVKYDNNKFSITQLTDKHLTGTVNQVATSLGSLSFAADIQIVDSTKNGSYIKVYPPRLAGLSLDSSDVRYYQLDSDGRISRLILNDVTGDMYNYGILTVVSESVSQDYNFYKYIVDGVLSTYNSPTTFFGAVSGPVQIELQGSDLIALKNLTEVHLSALNSAFATSDSIQYPIANRSTVYLFQNEKYSLSRIETVNNTDSYSLYGYYDKPLSKGGQIRVIVAYPK